MPKALEYSVEFVLALRKRWKDRDTTKKLCREFGWTRKQLLHLLKGDLPLLRKKDQMRISTNCANKDEVGNGAHP